jgi:phage shock protein PspC (stress-responsive transcriptional regulator)
MEIMNEPKKLYRSANRMLGGVCAGLAEYFNVDPTLIRVIAVLLFFTPLPAFLAYLVIWALVPERK